MGGGNVREEENSGHSNNHSMGDLPKAAERVGARLKGEFGESTFRVWLAHVQANEFDGSGRLTLTVPTRFICDWVKAHYADRLTELWRDELPGVQSLEFVIAERSPQEIVRTSADAFGSTDTPVQIEKVPGQPLAPVGGATEAAKVATDLPLDPRLTFENFVVGKSNEMAYAAARRVAEASRVSFNPLYLYGSVGLGKTHLMHAIAWEITRRDPRRKVLYLSAEKFMYQFVRALRYKDTMAFKDRFRSVDVLLIDDVQFIGGKDSTQEEFFHTFNALVDHNRQVVISADRSPSKLERIEERIRSRLGWGLAVDVLPTDYELRLGILEVKADELRNNEHYQNIEVPKEIMEFLASRIVSNVRDLEGALHRLFVHCELEGIPLTVARTEKILADLLQANNQRLTIEEIQLAVAEFYNLRQSDLLSARRARAVARPRQVAMWLAKQLTTKSFPEIGRKFGGRDHTTVMHAVRKVEELCEHDKGFLGEVDRLRRLLGG